MKIVHQWIDALYRLICLGDVTACVRMVGDDFPCSPLSLIRLSIIENNVHSGIVPQCRRRCSRHIYRCGCVRPSKRESARQKPDILYILIVPGLFVRARSVNVVSRQEFEVILKKPEGIDGAYFLVPFEVPKVYGTKAQVKVRGTIDGYPYRGSFANMGEGHCMVVKKEIRQAIGKSAGDKVKVVMEIDIEPRIVVVPEDFQQALENHTNAKEIFENFSYTHKKEYVEWIESAKKQETRENRIKKAIEMIAEGKKRS
jgi:bacteriocin resistance YdeI/OmpD-like protein/uncharacterized protein DUF1905